MATMPNSSHPNKKFKRKESENKQESLTEISKPNTLQQINRKNMTGLKRNKYNIV